MSNVSRGRALEWKARNLFLRHGYYVIRSAGSKGLADLVALRPGKTVLIQCKRGKARQTVLEARRFKDLAKWLQADAVLYENRRRGEYDLVDALTLSNYLLDKNN